MKNKGKEMLSPSMEGTLNFKNEFILKNRKKQKKSLHFSSDVLKEQSYFSDATAASDAIDVEVTRLL